MIRFLLVLVSLVWSGLALGQSPERPGRSDSSPKLLEGIASWGYQLQKASPQEIAASPFDLVVIDYSRNGTDKGRFLPGEIKAMQVKPDGRRRIVLAYMSIGEAEDYRYYWDKSWVEPAPPMVEPGKPLSAVPPGPAPVRIPRLVAPGWLGHENPMWRGNFLVRFWYDGWQEVIMHGDQSYLARIVGAGFDGVYLDRIDGYYPLRGDHRHAGNWMINFVVELGEIARKQRPGFIVVAQNAEELLTDPRYLAALDGIAKEDLLYGHGGDGERNSGDNVARALRYLRLAQEAGRAVMAVEYLDREADTRVAEAELKAQGFVRYFAPRKLDRLVMPTTTAAGAGPTPPERPQ